MSMAYPGEKSSLSEHIMRDSFLTSLGDTELELKIREWEPTDLDEALRIAQQFKVFKNAVESSMAERQRLNRQVVDCDMVDGASLDLEARLEKLEVEVSGAGKQITEVPVGEDALTERIIAPHDQNKELKRKQLKNHKPTRDDCSQWQTEIWKRINDLKAARRAVEQEMKRVNAENEALNKEVGRLRH